MMNFVHPNILYFLLLLAIPIIVHLFNFRRYKKLYFSSLQFIQKIEKETNSARNLRHYIILASRLLAFTALVLAFAQPYFPTGTSDAKMGDNIVSIYLDNSFSMSAKGTNGDLFNQAKTITQEIVDEYPKEQRFLLVTNSLDGTELRTINRSEVKDKLENIDFSPLSRSVVNPIESIKEYLSSTSFGGTAEYYILSDFQKRFLDRKDATIDTSATYTLLQLTPQIQRNLYIDSVWFEQPFQRLNTNNTLYVRIKNTGDNKLTNVEVNLTVGETKRQILADLEADNYTTVSIKYTDKSTGIKEGVVEIMDENLYFDNQFYFSYNVKGNINVLIINDENSLPFPHLVYQTDDYYTVNQTSIQQLKTEDLNQAELIVLNGLKSIGSGIQTQLHQLADNGVHLFIIPSANFEKESYNNLLGSFQLPLFREAVNQEIRIGKIATEFDFFAGMFDKKVENLKMPPLKSYISSSIYTNANFNSLIQYENGMPLLVQQAKEKNILALYTPIDPSFNDFGKSALFSSALLRAGEMSQGKTPLNLTIGSSEEFNIRRTSQNENAITLKNGMVEFIPEMSNHTGFSSISVRYAIDNQAIKDGIYSIIIDGKENGKLALNYNRHESDMDFATEKEITGYFNSLNAKHINTKKISSFSEIKSLIIDNADELWKIFLLLALLFFLVEMSLILFWKV